MNKKELYGLKNRVDHIRWLIEIITDDIGDVDRELEELEQIIDAEIEEKEANYER